MSALFVWPLTKVRARLAEVMRTVATGIARLRWMLYPTLVLLGSRLVIFGAAQVGDLFLPTEEGHWLADPDSPFLSMWAKWDSQWYIQIARDGYWFQPLQQSNVAFFPLYPLLVRLLGPFVGGNLVLAGFVLSNLAFWGALLFLYQLAQLLLMAEGGISQEAALPAARRALLYLAIFPTAFYFSAVYTESLFLLLSVATAYFARKQQWLLATCVGILAAATRNLGVMLWGLVLWEWLAAHGWRLGRIHRGESWRNLWLALKAEWPDWVIISTIPLGLFLYVAFLQVNFARPTAFIDVQAAWQRENIGPLAVVLREVQALMEFTLTRSNVSRLLNLGAFLGVLAMIPIIWRRVGEGYALYTLILLLVPATSALQSMIRYLLPMFPLFIVLGWWGRRELVDRSLLVTFALLLGVLTTIFVNWIFVA